MLLYASILGDLDRLTERIKLLEAQFKTLRSKPGGQQHKEQLIEKIQHLVRQRERSLLYRKRLQENQTKYLFIGSLDITTGRLLTPEHGMFGLISAVRSGFTLVVPEEAEAHAALIASGYKDVSAFVAKDLREVWNIVLGVGQPRRARKSTIQTVERERRRHIPDLREIEGVARGKKAIRVAIAGGHNVLFVGPPGQGKTMLAQAGTDLLPGLVGEEVAEINKIYSAKGELSGNEIIHFRPFREVQSAGVSKAALFGGGTRPILPGEISLAHHGVLLIDEINLCEGSLIEQLRSTLDSGFHRIQRQAGVVEFPCRFVLVAAMNPCKCGWYAHWKCPDCGWTAIRGDERCKRHPALALISKCSCKTTDVDTYKRKLSRPLLDRIDLKVMVSAFDRDGGESDSYASATVRHQIEHARKIQTERYKDVPHVNCNADIPNRAEFERLTPPIPDSLKPTLREIDAQLDSKRLEVKLLLVARTVADLDGANALRKKDIVMAAELMGLTNNPYFNDLA